MSSISCFMATNAPRRFTATRRSQSSSAISCAGLTGCSIPALLKAMSTPPKRSTAAAKAPPRRGQRVLDLIAARDVARDSERLPARLLDQPGGFAGTVGGHVGDHDARALTGEGQRGGAADAAGGAGDERDLAGEAGHGRRSVLIASRSSMAR